MLRALRNLFVLEVLAVTVFVGISAAVLLNRLSYYQEAAEKANMELVISSLQSALRIRIATMMIEGRAAQIPGLAQDNPMDWLEQKPSNYAGLTSSHAYPETLPGNWFFDPSTRALVYSVRHGDHFQPDNVGKRFVMLRLVLISEKLNAEEQSARHVTGARLVVAPYKWF